MTHLVLLEVEKMPLNLLRDSRHDVSFWKTPSAPTPPTSPSPSSLPPEWVFLRHQFGKRRIFPYSIGGNIQSFSHIFPSLSEARNALIYVTLFMVGVTSSASDPDGRTSLH